MTVKTSGGKLQHKAYCEKHSSEQRAKVYTLSCNDLYTYYMQL